MGRTCCVQKLFFTFRTIFVRNMFSPCSAKRRASDKDLPVFAPFGTLVFNQINPIVTSHFKRDLGMKNEIALSKYQLSSLW